MKNFIKTLNERFIEICKRSQFLCPMELWPILQKNGYLEINFSHIEDDINKYYLLIGDLSEVIRRKENKKYFLLIPEDLRTWLIDSRSYRYHKKSICDENGNFRRGSDCDCQKLLKIILILNKALDYFSILNYINYI